MTASSLLKPLFNHPALWQASQQRTSRSTTSTGYPLLDEVICDGGWPQGALTELLLPQTGVGEFKLLAPLLSRLSKQPGYQALIAPPHLPYAPYFNQQNIQLNKLLVIQANSVAERIWASQQALVSRSCSVVVCWLSDVAAYKSELRKLSLAARQGQSWGFILRPIAAAAHPSPASLRIKLEVKWPTNSPKPIEQKKPLQKSSTQLIQPHLYELEILKQTGSWHGKKVVLNLLPEQTLWTSQCAKDWPTYQTHAQKQNADYRLSLSSVTSTPLPTQPSVTNSMAHNDSGNTSHCNPSVVH